MGLSQGTRGFLENIKPQGDSKQTEVEGSRVARKVQIDK